VAAPAGPAPRALVFRLGGRVLAAAGGRGGRVIEVGALTRLPTAPAHVLGLANDQGTVLPVVDARPLLELPCPPWPRPLRAFVTAGELPAAFAVEEILGFEPYSPERLESPDDGLAAGLRRYARGSLVLPRWRATLLDMNRIVEALRVRRAG
jgi:chemotaxis signal transduction protein